MAFRSTDALRGPSRGDAITAYNDVKTRGAKRLPETKQFLIELYRLGQLIGLDAGIMVGQWDVETDSGQSRHWEDTLNPAGLDIFDDDAPAIAPFKNGTDAARAFMVDMAYRVFDRTLPVDVKDYADLDPHLDDLKVAAYPVGTFKTIADLSGRWAVDPLYDDKIVERANRIFPTAPDRAISPAGTGLKFGRVPHPSYGRHIVPKPWENAGFFRVAERKPVGVCSHRTWGLGTVEGIYTLFATGGEREGDALTDYVVGLDGRIWMLNDPRGTRSPWANGGSDGLEGDGPAFVSRFGITGINNRLVSIENIGLGDTPFAGAQFESSAQLVAYWHDQAKCPWHTFPMNPNYGVVTDLQHFEFATKDCPFGAFKAKTNAFQDRVRAILKQYQTQGTDQGTITPPKPVENPGHAIYPIGMDEALAKTLFGRGTRHNPDGTTQPFTYSGKGGPISLAWLARGKKTHQYPKALHWYMFADSPRVVRQMITFENGWVLWRPNVSAPWKWM